MTIDLLTIATISTNPSTSQQYSILKERVNGAVRVYIAQVLDASNSPASLVSWARDTIGSTSAQADLLMPYLLGANTNAADTDAIFSVSDAVLVSLVANAIETLYGG